MNSPSKPIVRRVLLTGLIGGLTGCVVIKVNVNSPKPEEHSPKPGIAGPGGPGQHPRPIEEEPWPPSGSYVETFKPSTPLDPSPSSGSLNVPINSFFNGNANQSCFPTSQGWDKYFPLPRYFLGPNVTPDAMSYTNTPQLSSVQVITCDPANGTTLQTGIVVYEAFNPNTDKVCATNAGANCLASPNLTIDPRSLQSGKKYRATVFYKSSTLAGLANVTIQWSYP